SKDHKGFNTSDYRCIPGFRCRVQLGEWHGFWVCPRNWFRRSLDRWIVASRFGHGGLTEDCLFECLIPTHSSRKYHPSTFCFQLVALFTSFCGFWSVK
ncbi:hypothetical protein CRG98_000927, partial [Punica granatum]